MPLESVERIIEAVQQLGFPIACVGVLFWLLYSEMADRRKRDAETAKVLAENTAAINSIRLVIEHLHGGVKS